MINEALSTFLDEAREVCTTFETALLACEAGNADADTVNALFRAMHTLKGSSGLFGLSAIAEFAHAVETTLDRVRSGALELKSDLVAVLIECSDHMAALVTAVGDADATAALAPTGEQLLARLPASEALLATAKKATPAVATANERYRSMVETGVCASSDCWHLSLRFMPEIYRSGFEPFAVLEYLGTIGEVMACEVVEDDLPPLEEFDAESCYLGMEVRFRSSADKQRIDSAFDFVRDDCIVTILPPHSKVESYVRLIQELPEADGRLGELLVRCGSLLQHELDDALRTQTQRQQERQEAPRLGEILIERGAVAAQVVEAAVEKQREGADARAREQRSVRVDSEKLDRLIDLVGELVTAGATTNLYAKRSKQVELVESAFRLTRLMEQVRDHALKLRMVQVGNAFARFRRVVRDIAREIGKDIRLELCGVETELDKSLIEKITDPLTHLIRNAVDHGIESAAVRRERGKPAQGLIKLTATQESGWVVIEVSDDGNGLDRNKIMQRAIERNLISEGANLPDHDVFALIFEPGFSTADSVTNLSGRGVGMDVVKRNVAALRGTIEVSSAAGSGAMIRLRLPLTLAIIDGFLVRVGGSYFVIPLEMVEECVEERRDETLFREQAIADYDTPDGCIDLRGEVLPILRLREHFQIESHGLRRQNVVVVRVGARRTGFVVDELLGEHQTVIKPLSRLLSHVRGLAGSTILAEGGIALVLDPPALMNQAVMIANRQSECDRLLEEVALQAQCQ